MMKLAEALQERADLNRRIEQLRMRLDNNAITQEGEKSAEDPIALIAELEDCTVRLEKLIGAINLTNSRTVVDGITLTEMIAKRDILTLKLGVYRNFLNTASRTAHRAMRTEIKIFSTVDVSEFQKGIDRIARELRITDNKIQETNWTTELQ